MIIPENNFSPVAITLSLSDIVIDTEKVSDTTAEIGGGLFDKLYLPFKDNDKLLTQIKDMVEEIAIANGYYVSNSLTFDEVFELFPDIKAIPYKTGFDIEYSANGTAELQVWIEPKNPEDKQYLETDMVLENIPVTLDNDDMKYLLTIFTEIIINEIYN